MSIRGIKTDWQQIWQGGEPLDSLYNLVSKERILVKHGSANNVTRYKGIAPVPQKSKSGETTENINYLITENGSYALEGPISEYTKIFVDNGTTFARD